MRILLSGNEAVARGAYEAGVRVASAYPGTPSTEITENIARYEEIYSEWSPNEKVAMEVAIGASFGGARSIVSMKHVGLNVAADPLFTAAYTGVNGGLVIAVADDPGMHSSQNEQDSRYYAISAHLPMLEPSDSQEAKDFVVLALELSEQFDTPVLLRLTTRISHSQSLVETSERRAVPLQEYRRDIRKNVMVPANARGRHVIVEDREKRLRDYSDATAINRIEWGSREIGIITSGVVYQYVREALGPVSVLKLGMVHPLPRKLIEQFVAGVKQLYVVEELEPVIETQVRSWGIPVTGKDLLPVQGELSVGLISRVIGAAEATTEAPADLPSRPPVMCPGCPHRGAFYALSKLKVHVTGDIGCYTLGALAPLNAMDTCVCMGASIGMALGMEKARGNEFGERTVAVIGDSTFLHSGLPALVDVVYNNGISTVLILDNSTTGMTGHQDHPSTGKTIKGTPAPAVDLVKLAEAVGVRRVRVVDPFDVDAMLRVLEEELEAGEPSVVIAKRPCVLLHSVPETGLTVNTVRCNACGKCLDLGCPAIQQLREKPEIDPVLCNACGLCVNVCNRRAIV